MFYKLLWQISVVTFEPSLVETPGWWSANRAGRELYFSCKFYYLPKTWGFRKPSFKIPLNIKPFSPSHLTTARQVESEQQGQIQRQTLCCTTLPCSGSLPHNTAVFSFTFFSILYMFSLHLNFHWRFSLMFLLYFYSTFDCIFDCILYIWLFTVYLTVSYTFDCFLYIWLFTIHLTVYYTVDCLLYSWLFTIHSPVNTELFRGSRVGRGEN